MVREKARHGGTRGGWSIRPRIHHVHGIELDWSTFIKSLIGAPSIAVVVRVLGALSGADGTMAWCRSNEDGLWWSSTCSR